MAQEIAKNRDTAIDAIKGLLVLLVVLAHNNASNPIILELCHPLFMGIFFMISGYLFSTKNTLKKIRTLIYSFLFFSIISIGWRFLYGFISHEALSGRRWFVELIMGLDWGLNIPMWFLLSLCEIIMIIYVINRYIHNDYLKYTIALLGMIIGLILGHFGFNPLYFSRSLRYVPFFIIGMDLKKKRDSLPKTCQYPMATILLLIGLIWMRSIIVIENYYFKWATDFILVFIFGALLYNFFKWPYSLSKIFEYYGRNSLVVLCMHILILDVVWRLWWQFFGRPNRIDALLQTVVIAICLIPFCEIYKRYISTKLK